MAMWVALTQYQIGKTFLFEHPTDASSWKTEMVSLVTGFKGVKWICVRWGWLTRTNVLVIGQTLVTNDLIVADALRPYRCARDHKHMSSVGGRRSGRAQEHDQFCEVLMTALKASLLHRDRR